MSIAGRDNNYNYNVLQVELTFITSDLTVIYSCGFIDNDIHNYQWYIIAYHWHTNSYYGYLSFCIR